MTTQEAVKVCEQWFAYLARERDKSIAIQRLATLARTDPDAARRGLQQIDRQPHVFDGAYLEPAVRHLVALAKETVK